MKKKPVSKDPLAEKIEEILTPYPDPMSRNDFRIVCHIGTRTSLYLLQSGLVPCKNNGKKTRCYKIAKKDVAEYLYRRRQLETGILKTEQDTQLPGIYFTCLPCTLRSSLHL